MIIDFHTHVGKEKRVKQSKDQLLKNMRKYKIDRSVVFPVQSKDQVKASVEVLEWVKKSKKLLPFFRFDPKVLKPAEIKDYLDMGFYGIKLHSRAEAFNPLSRRFFKHYKEISRLGVPLLYHVKKYNNPNTDPARIIQIAKHFPDLKLVLAHFMSSQPQLNPLLQKYPNVYVETSLYSTIFSTHNLLRYIKSDRILFGSDSPFADQEVELLKIKKADLKKQDMKKILGENAKKLLGI